MLKAIVTQEKKIQDGEAHLRRLQGEVADLSRQRDLRVSGGSSSNRDPELAVRLAQLKRYLDQVHEMVTSSLQRQQDPPLVTPERVRPEATQLTVAARKGDSKVEVQDSGFCVGEIVLIGGQEARTVISRSSLIFRAPLEFDYPEGTTVRHLRNNEFLQLEGEDLHVYARNSEGEIHFVCSVDMIQRGSPERAEERDDLQDQVYSDDLDQRVQRAVDARLAAQRPVVSGSGGPMVPPWSSAREWEGSRTDRRVPPLPEFGKKEEDGQSYDQGVPLYGRIKQEEGATQDSLDDEWIFRSSFMGSDTP